MKQGFARFALLVVACAFCSLLSSPQAAIACKADYCNGTNNNQPPPPGPPPPQQGTIPCFPNDATGEQAARVNVDSMPAAQLYSIFTQLYGIYDGVAYAFFNQLANPGLDQQIIDNKFGGDMLAYNTWINQMGYGDGAGSNFHFNTGNWSYYDSSGNLVTGTLAGWSSC